MLQTRRSILLLLLAALAFFVGCATTPDHPSEASAEAGAASSGFECDGPRRDLLWEVDLEQGSLYMLGSIHLGHPDFYPFGEAVEAAYRASDHLVLEVDPTKAQGQDMAMDLALRGMLPAGQTLADVVDPETRARVLELANGAGLPSIAIDHMRPWMVAVTLSALELQQMGYRPEDGVEQYFLAKLGDREILELESIEEQLALFEHLDGPTFLEYTLASMDQVADVASKLMTSWYCGDQNALADLIFDPYTDDPGMGEVMDGLFYDRNVRMADGIEALLGQPGHYFVVVGAGHLIGDRGIPALLEQRGFHVTQH